MRNKVIRLMAYVYMPLIFTVLGYFVIYIAAAPVLDMLQAVGSMVLAKEIPDFNPELKSIYNPQATGTEVSTEQDKNIISVKDVEFPDNGTQYANITCDRIKLDAPVYWGDTNAILKAGAGQFMGSFMPGFQKSILLSGHNTTFFKPLQNIKTGDIITFTTNYGFYEYKVSDVQVIHEKDAAAMRDELLSYDQEKLIMYTCYPFETLVGRKQQRLFVFADKIKGPEVR